MAGPAGGVRLWKAVYNRHRRWSADGTWGRVLRELQRDCDTGQDRWAVAINSTVVRAHQHAAGARQRPPRDVVPEVLVSALTEELAEAVIPDCDSVAVPAGATGG